MVADDQQSPTALRRWIALELKRLRTAAGRSPAEAAERLGKKTPGAYRHFETTERMPSPSDVEVLLNWYGKPDRVPFFRSLLAAANRGKDWWINFDPVVPAWFELYLGLEVGAATIRSYDGVIVPGLLQTEDYAEALYRAGLRGLTDDEIRTKVELRMARQRIFDRAENPPRFLSVLDESVLRRRIGSDEVMAEQFERLEQAAEDPNIDLRVLLSGAGAHAGVEGTFTILEYGPEFTDDPGTVYVETRPQGIYYEERAQVDDYREVFTDLLRLAEPREATPALIREAAKNFR